VPVIVRYKSIKRETDEDNEKKRILPTLICCVRSQLLLGKKETKAVQYKAADKDKAESVLWITTR